MQVTRVASYSAGPSAVKSWAETCVLSILPHAILLVTISASSSDLNVWSWATGQCKPRSFSISYGKLGSDPKLCTLETKNLHILSSISETGFLPPNPSISLNWYIALTLLGARQRGLGRSGCGGCQGNYRIAALFSQTSTCWITTLLPKGPV